jgi:hypothetical protein
MANSLYVNMLTFITFILLRHKDHDIVIRVCIYRPKSEHQPLATSSHEPSLIHSFATHDSDDASATVTPATSTLVPTSEESKAPTEVITATATASSSSSSLSLTAPAVSSTIPTVASQVLAIDDVIDACDRYGSWYLAKIVDIRHDDTKYYVQFEGKDAKHNEWVGINRMAATGSKSNHEYVISEL